MLSSGPRVARAFDQLLEKSPRLRIEQRALRLVVLSDLHRGKRDRADDFRQCEATYRHALTHYSAGQWQLFLLGDVEELWEVDAASSIDAYQDLLQLEGEFARRGALFRFVGNHDDLWSSPEAVEEHLSQFIAHPDGTSTVHEGLVLEIEDSTASPLSDQPSQILFAHGHQGSTLSDWFAPLSKILVRNFWRPIQRLTQFNTTALSEDYQLRHQHEIDLSAWAARQPQTLLVTGHTHHPVFSGEGHETEIKKAILEIDIALDQVYGREAITTPDRSHQEPTPIDIEQLEARKELLYAQLQRQLAESDGFALDPYESNSAYFNSGCCCFRSGSITGLEIEGREISLVRFRQSKDGIVRDVLRRDRLAAVFARCPASRSN